MTPSEPSLSRRAVAAFHGVAVGDALGLPAEFHRNAREPWQRGALWRGTGDLDDQRVSRPLLPFALTLDTGTVTGTDDTENLVIAARAMLASRVVARAEREDALFDAWLGEIDPGEWVGPAERIALESAARGMRAPRTGRDNPARGDDSAVVAGVAAAVLHSEDPGAAAELAGGYARIAHADDGVWGAEAMATAVCLLLDDADPARAFGAAERAVPADSWIADTFTELRPVVESGLTGFQALACLLDVVGVRDYSHPSLAARTVPAAFAIVRLTDGRLEEALPLSLALGHLSDSLPALVGALCGARGSEIPDAWGPLWRGGSLGDLDVVPGVLQPGTAGASLSDLARRMLTPVTPR